MEPYLDALVPESSVSAEPPVRSAAVGHPVELGPSIDADAPEDDAAEQR